MRRGAEFFYHGGATGGADAPQQAGVTLDFGQNNVLSLVVHQKLHGSLEETVTLNEIRSFLAAVFPSLLCWLPYFYCFK